LVERFQYIILKFESLAKTTESDFFETITLGEARSDRISAEFEDLAEELEPPASESQSDEEELSLGLTSSSEAEVPADDNPAAAAFRSLGLDDELVAYCRCSLWQNSYSEGLLLICKLHICYVTQQIAMDPLVLSFTSILSIKVDTSATQLLQLCSTSGEYFFSDLSTFNDTFHVLHQLWAVAIDSRVSAIEFEAVKTALTPQTVHPHDFWLLTKELTVLEALERKEQQLALQQLFPNLSSAEFISIEGNASFRVGTSDVTHEGQIYLTENILLFASPILQLAVSFFLVREASLSQEAGKPVLSVVTENGYYTYVLDPTDAQLRSRVKKEVTKFRKDKQQGSARRGALSLSRSTSTANWTRLLPSHSRSGSFTGWQAGGTPTRPAVAGRRNLLERSLGPDRDSVKRNFSFCVSKEERAGEKKVLSAWVHTGILSPRVVQHLQPLEGHNSGHELVRSQEVWQLVMRGVPNQLRGLCWASWTGATFRMLAAPRLYQHLLEYYNFEQSPATDQIELDLHRTFPNHPFYQRVEGIGALRRVLTAYSWRNHAVGYCQSMNIVASLMLLLMQEETAFWVVAALCEDHLPSYYSPTMISARTDQVLMQLFLGQHLPQIDTHLKLMGIDCGLLTLPMFLCLFIGTVPWPMALRMLDCFFYTDRGSLFKLALSLFDTHSAAILKCFDPAEIKDLWLNSTVPPDTVINVAFSKYGSLNWRAYGTRVLEEKAQIINSMKTSRPSQLSSQQPAQSEQRLEAVQKLLAGLEQKYTAVSVPVAVLTTPPRPPRMKQQPRISPQLWTPDDPARPKSRAGSLRRSPTHELPDWIKRATEPFRQSEDFSAPPLTVSSDLLHEDSVESSEEPDFVPLDESLDLDSSSTLS
jgi:hypothetical protein